MKGFSGGVTCRGKQYDAWYLLEKGKFIEVKEE